MEVTVLSDYGLSLRERLGQGSYATVYKANSRTLRSNGTREVVAVKCIQKSKVCVTQAAQDNLIREIDILKRLTHPNIVKLVDFLWDKDNVYIIMEYCNAGDLSQYIKKRSQCDNSSNAAKALFSLPEPLTRKFLQQLASAMKYLRSKQISHMDLKPQNILLSINFDNSITLKIADFGFATKLRYADRATSLRGSPLYMAPEILKEKSYDLRVDIWSIGVILYECLFGRPPFSSNSLTGLIDKIISDDPVVIPSKPPLSPCCRNLLVSLLKKDPMDRLTFYEFFTHPFVDENYCPRQEAFDEATKLYSEAEESNFTQTALRLYCLSLDYFLTSLQYIKIENKVEREELRKIIKAVMAKAEALKVDITPNNCQGDSESLHDEDVKMLKCLWSDTPQVDAALTIKNYAEGLLRTASQNTSGCEGHISIALQKYQLCIESLLKVLNDARDASDSNTATEKNRLKILKSYIQRCLTRAEEIKGYLEIKQFHLSAHSVEEKEQQAATTIEEKTRRLLDEKFCRLQ